ncbi:MAG: hypothetical protein M1546_06590 [Chloroflexi bacterium]|nr:hypothetical protein [Chloroflexota bacterium]
MSTTLSDLDLIYVRNQLAEGFTLDELETLCDDLQIKYENLPAATLIGKARELVKYCYRYSKLQQLVRRCAELRPETVWDKPASSQPADSSPEAWDHPLQQLYRLVKAFNRNRNQPFSAERTRLGDDIAYQMREAAPFLFGQFDLAHWLNSSNAGKRLAAIKYLDWLQDIEFLDNLLGKLTTESPFIQLHALMAIHSMLDQLNRKYRTLVRARLTAYNILRNDAVLEFWKDRILEQLSEAG